MWNDSPAPVPLRARTSVVFAATFLAGCGAPRGEGPPAVPDGFVFRPTFRTTQGEARAGTAFLIRIPECPALLLISAAHVLGPAGGLSESIRGKMSPRR